MLVYQRVVGALSFDPFFEAFFEKILQLKGTGAPAKSHDFACGWPVGVPQWDGEVVGPPWFSRWVGLDFGGMKY